MGIHIDSEDAAGILGVRTAIAACKILRDRGVAAITAGGSVRNQYEARDVVQVAFDRRREALARHRNDAAAYAREIVARLRPPAPRLVDVGEGRKVAATTPTAEELNTRQFVRDSARKDPDAIMIFGPGVITAAAADLKSGTCRYCVAHIETPWGGIGPDLSEACAVLLGQPCLKCKVDLTPPKRTAAARTARKRATRPSAGLSAGGGPNSPVYWRSQAQNALTLADQARARGDHAESRRLRDRAAEYARKAGS